jgi:integrase
MPRKPKPPEKQTVNVVIDGVPVPVRLHPPEGRRASWYAYWPGLVASRTTGHSDLGQATATAESMVRAWKAGGAAHRPTPEGMVLSDDEFEAIQRAHYGKKQDEDRARAEKSLTSCLEAVRAFRAISGVSPISVATPDDCAAFQRKALALPRNWRQSYPKSRPDPATISPSTVRKWSVALAAAFERCTRTAKDKCIRGLVAKEKLLAANPWHQFAWLAERVKRPVRQFDAAELTAFLDFLADRWADVTVAAAVAKVLLWSGARRDEVMGLTWDQHRHVQGEHHFSITGKHGVRRWFRVPPAVYRELDALRVAGDRHRHLFAVYPEQLRRHHGAGPMPYLVKTVGDAFDPVCLGDWFYERVREWSASLPKGAAYIHIFRKTVLQFALEGEESDHKVAADARLTERVMLGHYTDKTEVLLHARSNATYLRLLAGLPDDVAARYGYERPAAGPLEELLQAATEAKNYELVARLAAELASRRARPTG